MYQVFEASDIFGQRPPLSANDDFTLQRRYRGPDEGGGAGGSGGGGIDDVLGWLGLPSPGGGTRAGYDDPGGGGGGGGGGLSWLPSGLRALDEAGGFGQLMMETENSDEAEYFDYSCLSSGLMSPDVESEFFGAPCVGGRPPLPPLRSSATAADPYCWSFNPSCSSTLPDRPPSPLFADFRFNAGSDVSFPVVTSCGDLPFDSEAEERVREIARYLASFEVQPWSVATPRSLDSTCSTPGSDPTSPFQELGSSSTSMSAHSTLSASQLNGTTINSAHKLNSGINNVPVGFFHAGFDDSSCGLETTMVNPNDVFPDRTDHQYASSSRPPATRDHPPRAARHQQPPRSSSQRTSPHHSVTPPKVRASSVLEALLRSTEPIDPNKGSGAAVAMEDDGEDGEQRGMGRRSPERIPVKKGRVGRDDDLVVVGRKGGQRNRVAEETLRAAAASATRRMNGSETEVEFRASGGTSGGTSGGSSGRTFAGFVDIKQETSGAVESELARELRQIIGDETMRKTTTTGYSFASEFRAAECFRCN